MLTANSDTLLSLIKDAHSRMATNRDSNYRAVQRAKIDGWLEELTKLYEAGKWMPGCEREAIYGC